MISSAVFSPDGQRVFTASRDGTAKFWDMEGKLLTDSDRHNDTIYSTVFSPNGSRVLTASRDNIATTWNKRGNLLADLDKHKNTVTTAIFSSDGQRILTASQDGIEKLLDFFCLPRNFREISNATPWERNQTSWEIGIYVGFLSVHNLDEPEPKSFKS